MKPFLKTLFQEQTYHQHSFFLMAGPCVVESEKGALEIASTISEICQKLQIPYVFKASYRKANRTSASSFTGIGDLKALEILQQIRAVYKVPIVTDIHTADEAKLAAPYVDILQIPAFLCRQTDLLMAAAETGKIVNIKKGQFLSGAAMRFAVEKITGTGNEKVLLTERGTTFGYQDLVVDFRNIPWMQEIGVPVVMDVTHALQQPNQTSGITGGNPQLIGTLAKAAIATGAEGLFIETHPNPSLAKSDGANMLPLNQLQSLLEQLIKIRKAISTNEDPQ
ncbi:MAG: 3-deoxy-8-phosphooctulonate synthase [Bacteroidota bacterium]|jgi:2-dehydro-3-deoxyphosphooctonate aldolase (KDO 8-P synthase)